MRKEIGKTNGIVQLCRFGARRRSKGLGPWKMSMALGLVVEKGRTEVEHRRG